MNKRWKLIVIDAGFASGAPAPMMSLSAHHARLPAEFGAHTPVQIRAS
jgi:hypothetical protein